MITTYGKKSTTRAPVNSNENQWDPFVSAPYQFATSNVEPTTMDGKETVAQKKTKKEFGASSQHESTAFSTFTGASKKKKKGTNEITNGNPEDIDFLLRAIDKRQAGISVHSIHKLIVPPPFEANSKERDRCSTWLSKIGFEQTSFGTFNLPMDQVYELERILKTTIKPVLNHSVSSEFFASESSSSRSDDYDRSLKASEKLRSRSASNPPPMLTTSNLAENTPAPNSWSSRIRSNSTFSNPASGLMIHIGRNRRGTTDSNDSSDYLESPACFPDNFSPMNGSKSIRRPDSSSSRRAPSPWQYELGEQLSHTKISGPEDEEGFGASSSSSNGAGGLAASGFALGALGSAKHALHCIHEEDHDHPNDLTLDEDGIKHDLQIHRKDSGLDDLNALAAAAASIPEMPVNDLDEGVQEDGDEDIAADHDSDTATVIDENELPEEAETPSVTSASALHVSSNSMDHSPSHMHVLMGHSQNHSFSSPSSGGRVDPVVIPIAMMSHASPPTGGSSSVRSSIGHGVTFHQGHLPHVTRSTSLFGDSSSTSYGGTLASSAANAASPDMLAFKTQRPLGGYPAGGAQNRQARNNRNEKLNMPAKLTRSVTEPYNIASLVIKGDCTPAPKGLTLSIENHFNTPQAVLQQTEWEWEKSTPADQHLMTLLKEKLTKDLSERPEDIEQAQRCHEMSSLSTQGCELHPRVGSTPSFAATLSHMSPSSDDSRIESLASAARPRDSLGYNDPGRPPLSAITQAVKQKAQGMARTLIRGRSCYDLSSGSSSGSNILMDTQSPLHPIQSYSSSSEDFIGGGGAFAAEAASTVTDRMRRDKLKKSRTKQRRMSIAFKSAMASSNANNRSLLNNSSMDTSDIMNTSREQLLFSPGVKSKTTTSTRSRRRSLMNLSMSRMEPMGGVGTEESQACLVDGTAQNEEDGDGFVVVSTKNPSPDECDESKFKGVVIGGSYQHCFDEGAPLVSAAGSEDNRVVDLTLTPGGNLSLQVYLSAEKTCHCVDLGVHWTCIRAAPTGYLVYKNDEEETGMSQDSWAIGDVIQEPVRMYFYLNKDPEAWMKSPLHKASRSGVATRRSNVSGPLGSQDPAHFFRMPEVSSSSSSMVSAAIFKSHFLSTTGGDIASLRGTELKRGTSLHEDFCGRDSLTASDDGMDVCFNNLEHPDTTVVFDPDNLPQSAEVVIRNSASSSVWSNAWLMCLVFSYLTEMKSSSSGGKSPRGNSGAARRRLAASLRSVCKTWALAGYMRIARDMSDVDGASTSVLKYEKWCSFARKYNWGKFLSEGACKKVYCISNPSVGGRLEAVSVMDIDDLRDREMTLAVTQELEISMLCSTLTQLNICPNLVQVHSMFQSEFGAPDAVWNGRPSRSQAVSVPAKKSLQAGSHQFIRMEFCTGGDVEEQVRKMQKQLMPLEVVRSHLFQMCFALYACREQISLRHFDIKLLNFFATSGSSLLAHPESYARGSVDLHYGFGKNLFRLTISAAEAHLIKLADFGTSCVGKQQLGDPITLQQFTTLENTPIEYFLLGSQARQCYAADTFSLGLCVVHLMTGLEPYEELLKDVKCPKYLQTRLEKIWMTKDESSQYFLIRECIESIQAAEAESESDESLSEGGTTSDDNESRVAGSGLNVLYDTLYRYLVLFGAMDCGAAYVDNPVWSLLLESLELTPIKKKASKARNECVTQFRKDYQLWSIESGTHPTMLRARDRIFKMPGVIDLLRSMTHFDPSKRCSMYEALHSPLFECFRIQHLSASSLSAHGGSASFMHYFRGGTAKDGSRVSNSDVVLDNLPIL